MPLDRRKLEERAIALAWVLRLARQDKNCTQQACADYLGTSRQRYGRLEAGTILISAAEYEAMLLFLEVPLSEAWPEPSKPRSSKLGPSDKNVRTQRVSVDIEPGETVRVILHTR